MRAQKKSAKKPLRASFVVTLAVAATGVPLVACGLDRGNPIYGTDGGGPTGTGTNIPEPPPEPTTEPFPSPPPGPSLDCPGQEPAANSPCYANPGTSCSFVDGCESRPSDVFSEKTFACLNGVWTQTSKHYAATCPVGPPTPGDSCAACAPDLPAQCTYGDDSGCSASVAVCDPKTLTWNVAISTCNPPAPDAGAGGGP